jgi:hypothetical protein
MIKKERKSFKRFSRLREFSTRLKPAAGRLSRMKAPHPCPLSKLDRPPIAEREK